MPLKGTILLKASFDDMEQFCEATKNWDLDFVPLGGSLGKGSAAEIVQIRFGCVDFGSARLRAPLDQAGMPPAHRHTFVLLSDRTPPIWWRGQQASSDEVMVFHEGAELRAASGPDFLNLCLSIEEAEVAAIAEREHVPLPALRQRPEVFRPPPARVAAARAILMAAREGHPGATVERVEKITADLVLSWLQQAGLRTRPANGPSKDRAVTHCLELIDAAPGQQIPVAALCVSSGVSRRTLETAFLDRFGVGPAAFMKRARLGRVRRELLVAGPSDVQVGEVMARYGFTHVGQFATDYRRAFGERPSETLARVS
ncbi:helix-turn-helix domain-containing protein [Tropicimonas marinistellae]|uniref:helix-turn-helix domain-containing protein n=1 Tax=Tropicimonas marinistellae TaxID=1739787 RepID=UPI000832EC26|nr:helix-turn-helix domain-containing protein [Tropicimonas marinistellae]